MFGPGLRAYARVLGSNGRINFAVLGLGTMGTGHGWDSSDKSNFFQASAGLKGSLARIAALLVSAPN
jgi:hypothetical protein